jgi:tRNA(Ile)-lysidine synthase TilS/MesJ
MTEALPPAADLARADKLAFYLQKALGKANRRYRLLADGDIILVAVSGGKDSMSLLDLLWRRQVSVRERYTLVAGHIRADAQCGRGVSEDWLRAWCAERGIPLVVDEIAVVAEWAAARAAGQQACFRCAWLRRKALFDMATRLGCNKLAFAHHADDIAETTLMNLFYNATFRPMEARMPFFGGRFTVIRPFAYVEERDIVTFATASGYPLVGERCPEAATSRRTLVRGILRELDKNCHGVRRRICAAAEHAQADVRLAINKHLPDDLAS